MARASGLRPEAHIAAAQSAVGRPPHGRDAVAVESRTKRGHICKNITGATMKRKRPHKEQYFFKFAFCFAYAFPTAAHESR